MILILTNDYDHSTNEVVKWLNFYNEAYLRVNYLNELDTFNHLNADKIISNIHDINLNQISCVWFRRTPEYRNEKFNKKISDDFNNILKSEYFAVYGYLVSRLYDRFWLNNPMNSNLNKIAVLELAKTYNLKVPKTFITKNTDQIKKLLNKYELISKPIFEVPRVIVDNDVYTSRTIEIKKDKLFGNISFISKFQEKIDKVYEIRTVYLMGDFYSMSIHSQENTKTKIDFRHYDLENPNRCCPIKLPSTIEKKIAEMMKKLNLNFGSIDLILDKKGDIYFLEINPVGQFGMTSTPNNYLLEKKIANILIQKSNEYKNRQ